MNLFPVYKTFDIQLRRGKGCQVFDEEGNAYLDLYGGHAVISIGHGHPVYVQAVSNQLKDLAYYSNSVRLPIQNELAQKLGELSDCKDYQLFLCNSGAEAVENAIKLASFHTGRKKIIAFEGSFHGRTHGALAVTDNDKIRSAINSADHVIRLPFNDEVRLEEAFQSNQKDIAAVILEPIQGVGGVQMATKAFLQLVERLCEADGALFIADEVQSGFGRCGKFFSFQYAEVHPDLISIAKGMGNGFPVGGVLIDPNIKASFGLLGTTFGGNPLACSAAIAVLDVLKDENLIEQSMELGNYFMEQLGRLDGIQEVRGRGLMIGVEFDFHVAELRNSLVENHSILTGSAKDGNVLRFLPPLTITKGQIDHAISCLATELSHLNKSKQ